jgi:uncharacterized protein (DUF1015 family)
MDLKGFRGWRFVGDDGDVSSLIAPPYDVLNAQQKAELLARSDHNIIAVDLPHVPPKEPGPDAVYAQAARTLETWQAEGTLQQDDTECLYVYDQTYTWAGKTYTRRALLAGVRATPLGADQDVIPHEHTFAGPKADRLKLTQATFTQLSPIFGFYHDPADTVGPLLASQTDRAPDLRGELNGVDEALWVIRDQAVIAKLREAFAAVPAFIADGHHRYTTAMNYRDSLRNAGEIDDAHEANYVLFALVSRDCEGLLVLPTHRLVSGLAESFSLEALREAIPGFTWQAVEAAILDLSDADAALADFAPHAMAFAAGDGKTLWIGTLDTPEPMLAAEGSHCEAWRELDVAILQSLIMDGALEAFKTGATAVDYTPDGNAALASVAAGEAQLAIIMRGTPAQAVEAVALAGEVMPHKSTYFYPKLSTGMVLKPLL